VRFLAKKLISGIEPSIVLARRRREGNKENNFHIEEKKKLKHRNIKKGKKSTQNSGIRIEISCIKGSLRAQAQRRGAGGISKSRRKTSLSTDHDTGEGLIVSIT